MGDTIEILFIPFHNSGAFDTILPTNQLHLVKSTFDDTFNFNYFIKKNFIERDSMWNFIVQMPSNEQWVDLIDSFELTIIGIKTILYKYDQTNTSFDGECFNLISKDFGLLGLSHCTW